MVASLNIVFGVFTAFAAAVVAAPAGDNATHVLETRDYRWKPDKFYSGNAFMFGFDFETLDDPNHSRVNYVNGDEAMAKGLVQDIYETNEWIIRTDSKNKVDSWARGRDSVRMISKDQWKEYLMVADIKHVPVGPGVWPALWTLGFEDGKQWPAVGEIDILEQARGDEKNWYTIHTGDQCSVRTTVDGQETTARQASTQCQAPYGCRFESRRPESWGHAFNNAGGGWIVTRITDQGVAFWFFPRNADNVPDMVKNGEDINEDALGIKDADFKFDSGCSMPDQFSPQRVIINIALCGEHASSEFGGDSAKCAAHVDANPDDYKDAYWIFNSLHMYTRA